MPRDWLAGGDRRDRAAAAIRRAALEVLEERGLERFTAEAVADRAGCSRATLYRSVGGKRALLDALLVDAGRELVERVLEHTRDLDGADRISAGILGTLRAVRANPAISEFVRRAASTDLYLGRSDQFAVLASTVTGIDPTDKAALAWVHRIFVSFIIWPGEDEQLEEHMISAFLAPVFDNPDKANGPRSTAVADPA